MHQHLLTLEERDASRPQGTSLALLSPDEEKVRMMFREWRDHIQEGMTNWKLKERGDDFHGVRQL